MRSYLLAAVAAASLLLGPSAYASVLDDPLHGEVCSTGAAGCNTDNGSFSPITLGVGGNVSFGWSFSGPAGNNIGNLVMVVLAPVGDGFVSPLVTGTNLPASGSLLNFAGVYTSGDLATFLGLSAGATSPANPFGGFQVGANTGVTAFNVFTLNVPGLITLTQQGQGALNDFFNASGGNIVSGIDIVAFLENTPGGNIATALSGQLQVQPNITQTPLPGAVAMFGPVLLGGWYWLRRRRSTRLA